MYKTLILGNGFHINISRDFQFSNFVKLNFEQAQELFNDINLEDISNNLLNEILRNLTSEFRRYQNLSFMYDNDIEAFLTGLIDSMKLDLDKKKQQRKILNKLFISWVWNAYKKNENKYTPELLERLKWNFNNEAYNELIDFNYLDFFNEEDSILSVTHPHGFFENLETNPANSDETKIIISNTDKVRESIDEISKRFKIISDSNIENIDVEIFGLSIRNDATELIELFKEINTKIVTITYYYFSYKDLENALNFFKALFETKKSLEKEDYIWFWQSNNDQQIEEVKIQFAEDMLLSSPNSNKEYEKFLLKNDGLMLAFRKLINKPQYQYQPIFQYSSTDLKNSYIIRFKSFSTFLGNEIKPTTQIEDRLSA